MKKIITISRQYGACGSTIGRRLAEELGIEYYDRDIILRTAAESTHLSPDVVRQWDEKVPHEFGLGQSLFNFYSKPLSEELWDAQRDAIRKMADEKSCVIVGRNADYILREFDHILRVFLYADQNWRIQHMIEKEHSSREEILPVMEKSDKARAGYCKRFTGQVYGAAPNYDLCLNVGKLGVEKSLQLILEAVTDL